MKMKVEMEINEEPRARLPEILPFWGNLTESEKDMITRGFALKEFGRNQMISSSDSSCVGMIFVLEGGIRASLISDEGREITLYRLSAGECCVTTASCVISEITFETVVSAVSKTKMLVIPSTMCSYLAEENIYFRAFMFETETKRFSQAIWVIQQLLFKRFDQRLAAYLLSEYEKSGKEDLKLTQEEIARNVNSAREVVARMLRHFADEGLVEVRRGHIILKDTESIRKLI